MNKNWHKPTQQDKLNEANKYFKLPKKKRKYFDWWDKVKIAMYEKEADAEFTVIEQKQLTNGNDNE